MISAASNFQTITAPTTDKNRQLGQMLDKSSKAESGEMREAFDSFVGNTFYSQMLSSLRKTQEKTPYFDGGRAEEIFRGQLDQQLAEQMTKATAHDFTGPMFDLFTAQRH